MGMGNWLNPVIEFENFSQVLLERNNKLEYLIVLKAGFKLSHIFLQNFLVVGLIVPEIVREIIYEEGLEFLGFD